MEGKEVQAERRHNSDARPSTGPGNYPGIETTGREAVIRLHSRTESAAALYPWQSPGTTRDVRTWGADLGPAGEEN